MTENHLSEGVRRAIIEAASSNAFGNDFIDQNIEPFLENIPPEALESYEGSLEVITRREKRQGDAVLTSKKVSNIRFNLKKCLFHLTPTVTIDSLVVTITPSADYVHMALLGVAVILKTLMIFHEGMEVELSDDEARIILALVEWEREGKAPLMEDVHKVFDNLLKSERVEQCIEYLEELGCVRRYLKAIDGEAKKLIKLNETVVYQ